MFANPRIEPPEVSIVSLTKSVECWGTIGVTADSPPTDAVVAVALASKTPPAELTSFETVVVAPTGKRMPTWTSVNTLPAMETL